MVTTCMRHNLETELNEKRAEITVLKEQFFRTKVIQMTEPLNKQLNETHYNRKTEPNDYSLPKLTTSMYTTIFSGFPLTL